MNEKIELETNKILRKDFINYLVIVILGLLSLMAPFIGLSVFNITDPNNKPSVLIFPLMLPFIFCLFIAVRYFTLHKNHSIFTYKIIWYTLFVLTISMLVISLYYLFATFLTPSFAFSFKKVDSVLKTDLINKYNLVKNITYAVTAVMILVMIIMNGLVIFLVKNLQKLVGEGIDVTRQYN